MVPKTDHRHDLMTLDEISDRLEKTLAESPADETEIVWIESRVGYARRQRSRIDLQSSPARTILVRVLDLGRVGSHRIGSAETGELADAVRFAMAQARVREPLTGLQHLPADDSELSTEAVLYDPEIAGLGRARVKKLLSGLQLKQENAHLHWAEGRVAVFNSRGVRRRAQVTSISLEVRTGRRPGAARARDAARLMASVDPAALLSEARSRHAEGDPIDLPSEPVPLLLSPMATIELCDLLNSTSFSAKAYYDGTSFLREHVNVQVFDRRVSLRDDGTDPTGLPFPFDLEGTAKRPVDLIARGAPKTPALDQRQAAVLGLPPTAHAIGGNDARAGNLFLLPGEEDESDLLAAGEGGLWVGWLEGIESLDPKRVRFRARARGVRAIRDGGLGPAVPDILLEDSLLRTFSSIIGIGQQAVRRLGPGGVLGGTSAPAVAASGIRCRSASSEALS